MCAYVVNSPEFHLVISIVIMLLPTTLPASIQGFSNQLKKKILIQRALLPVSRIILPRISGWHPTSFFFVSSYIYIHTRIFFFVKRICTTPRQERVLCSSNVLKKEKKFLQKRKFIQGFFFSHSKRNVSHHLPLGLAAFSWSLKKRSCTSNTTVSFLM